jgi:hypothetical protein
MILVRTNHPYLRVGHHTKIPGYHQGTHRNLTLNDECWDNRHNQHQSRRLDQQLRRDIAKDHNQEYLEYTREFA